jgi:hypothetical protein
MLVVVREREVVKRVAAVLSTISAIAWGTPPRDPDLSESVKKVSKIRILFGHQSVGQNVLTGLAELSGARAPTTQVSTPGTWVSTDPPAVKLSFGINHFFVGSNEAPLSKISAFKKTVEATGGEVDVALFKFCFVDFAATTDVDALFTEYQRAMAELKARYPKVVFGYATVPLTLVGGGVKGWLQRKLGSGAWGERENVRRNAFNEKLRAAYPKELVFDLARYESTRDDGTIETYEVDGKTVPKLRADFSDDGGHLNAAGREAVAAQFLAYLASLSGNAQP